MGIDRRLRIVQKDGGGACRWIDMRQIRLLQNRETAMNLFASSHERVNQNLISLVVSELTELLSSAEEWDEAEMEEQVWRVVLGIGRMTMQALVGLRCWAITKRELEERGFAEDDISFRNTRSRWPTVTTTFGEVEFPWFSYCYQDNGKSVTRTPARQEVFVAFRRCKSSRLCLRWEAELGSRLPFREAQELLELFTHGAVSIEDTTIAKHCRGVGGMVDRSMMYASPADIRSTLDDHATRDVVTGRPILYVSCDAHDERLYADDNSWQAGWKHVNAIRLWCVDRDSGDFIPIGGEFIFGDCHAVSEAFQWLQKNGVLPKGGEYGDGVTAQYVWVADGMPWFDDHILAHFDTIIPIIDVWHVLERVSKTLKALYGDTSTKRKQLYRKLKRLALGKTTSRSPQKMRKGHSKGLGPTRPTERVYEHARSVVAELELDETIGGAFVYELCQIELIREDGYAKLKKDLNYLLNRLERMQYRRFHNRGFSISSAPMESFHRHGAQRRLKIPGARWTKPTADALLRLRMLRHANRSDEFWNQENFDATLAETMDRQRAA